MEGVTDIRPLARNIDEEWLKEAVLRMDSRYPRSLGTMADELGVDLSQLSKLRSGERAPAYLVMAVSRKLNMAPPRALLDPIQYRWLELLERVRARPELSAEAITERIERAVGDMLRAAEGSLELLQPPPES